MRKKGLIGGIFLLLAVFAAGCGKSDLNAWFLISGEEQEEETEKTEQESLAEEEPEEPDLHPYDFVLTFAGDLNLAENWNTMEFYKQQEDGIYDCIDPELIQKMKEADLCCVNQEFCISAGGSPMEGKTYTFRADPSRLEILKELGVDLSNLANNHVYDYGTDAFLEMLELLEAEGISYVGAGRNAEEAQSPCYFSVEGKTVAILSATRAEKYILTPEAGQDSPGVFRCYDREALLEKVQEADQTADYVIAYIHWGTEYSEELEEAQTEGARELVDAGADVVLGAHPHCLQGVEFYHGAPILYSLGNYWFNEKPLDSVLVQLRFYGDDQEQKMEVTLVPAKQENHVTRLLKDPEEIRLWKEHLQEISPGTVEIDEKGRVKDGNQSSISSGA